MASNKLALKDDNVDLALWADIAYGMAGESFAEVGNVPSVQLLCEKYGLSKRDAINIVAHPKFAAFFHNVQKALAAHEFDRVGFQRLVETAKGGSTRDALRAIKLLAELVGYKESGAAVHVTFNFEKEIKRLEGTRVDDDVIEAEVISEFPGM